MNNWPLHHRILLTTLGLLLVLGLTGCGFQPRGQALSLSSLPGPLAIVGIPAFSPLHRELTSQLKTAGIDITENLAGAGSILRLSGQSGGKRVLSVNSRNKQVEYELEESVRFSVRSGNDDQRIPEQLVRVVRIQYNPETEVLGRGNEELSLRKDMRRDLANRVLQRIAAQH